MKLFELFESDFSQSIQNILLDYLTALISKGNKKISVKQVIGFLKETKKIHITPNEIEDLLDNTGFELKNNVIVVRQEPDENDIESELENNGPPNPNDVVGNMAQDRLAKELE